MLKYLVWSWKIGEIVSFVGSSLILSLFLPSCILCKWHSSQPTFFRSFFGNYFPEKFFLLFFVLKKWDHPWSSPSSSLAAFSANGIPANQLFFQNFFGNYFSEKVFFIIFCFKKVGSSSPSLSLCLHFVQIVCKSNHLPEFPFISKKKCSTKCLFFCF